MAMPEDAELPSSMSTLSLQVHMEPFPLKNPEGWLSDNVTLGKQENHIEAGRRGWDTTSRKPHPWCASHSWEGTRNPEFLPEE